MGELRNAYKNFGDFLKKDTSWETYGSNEVFGKCGTSLRTWFISLRVRNICGYCGKGTCVLFKSPIFPEQPCDYDFFIGTLTCGFDSTAVEAKMFTYSDTFSKFIEFFLSGGKMTPHILVVFEFTWNKLDIT